MCLVIQMFRLIYFFLVWSCCIKRVSTPNAGQLDDVGLVNEWPYNETIRMT